ncbi:MAG: hypothetical protein HC853_00700 [Anaerolineae bacterium]|nr:hypothetical protein [Anaerolineae bacterium]
MSRRLYEATPHPDPGGPRRRTRPLANILRLVLALAQMLALLGISAVAVVQPTLPEPIASLQPLIGLPQPAQAAVGGLTITTSGCYPSGGLSKSTVQVEIPYSGLVLGDRITATLTTGSTTITKTFLPESPAVQPVVSPVIAAFEISANSAPFTVTVRDSKGGLQTGTGVAPPPCPTLTCNAGNLGGQAFNDYNSDGVKNTLETIGVAGIRVDVQDRLGNTYSTTTDVDGLYAFTTIPSGNYPVRLQFSNIPAVYGQGTALGANNASSVQFPSAPICTAHFSLLNPADYSEPNPTVAIPRYNRGDPLSVGVVPTFAFSAIGNPRPYQTSMFSSVVMYSSTLNTNNAYVAGIQRRVPAGQTGSLWGAAWAKQRSMLYLSSVLRRYAGYGPLGPGGLYQWNRLTNATSPLVDVRSLGINVGSIPSNAARGLTATLVSFVGGEDHYRERDTVEAEVGQVGMGDLEISDDGNTLYFTNLHLRTLHSYDLVTGAAATYTLPYSDTSPLPSATCVDGVARPWATKVKDGKVYVGVVCDGSLNPSLGYTATAASLLAARSDLRAKVFAFDIAAGTFAPAPVFDFPLTYPKGAPIGSNDTPREYGWWPWTDKVPALAFINSSNNYGAYGRIDFYIWPEPILMDIEFDVDGSMVLAFGDRGAMQMGWGDHLTTGAVADGNTLHAAFVGGDLLRAYKRGNTFILENAGKAGPTTGCCPTNNQGPGGGEFYNENFAGHEEVMMGGLALRPGSGEIIGAVMDPNTAQASGTRTWSNTTGQQVRSVRAVNSDTYPRLQIDPASFGKAGGMGDIELMSDIPRYQEVGTRLWTDIDGDGIQDPNEPGLANTVVVLYDLAGNAVATGTTNANGVVVFMANGDPRLSSSGIYSNSANIPSNTTVITGLVPGQQYVLRVPLTQTSLDGVLPSPPMPPSPIPTPARWIRTGSSSTPTAARWAVSRSPRLPGPHRATWSTP